MVRIDLMGEVGAVGLEVLMRRRVREVVAERSIVGGVVEEVRLFGVEEVDVGHLRVVKVVEVEHSK